ncbi:MAG: DNA repair protein RecO [Alphaproteobacteria bacterium]
MEWTDDALLLSIAKHGESSAIADLLTSEHGRYKGLIRGASSSRLRGVLQPGNLLRATWKARLSEHLGTLTVELAEATAAHLLAKPNRLAALSCLCAVASVCLPEREPAPSAYQAASAVIALLTKDELALGQIGLALVHWEMGLLQSLGYGLDLSVCAVTGEVDGLAFVSPKTGRAVSRAGAGDYAERLLPLPVLTGSANAGDVLAGFQLTGHFLDRNLLVPNRLRVPPARDRFVDQIRQLATTSGAP